MKLWNKQQKKEHDVVVVIVVYTFEILVFPFTGSWQPGGFNKSQKTSDSATS